MLLIPPMSGASVSTSRLSSVAVQLPAPTPPAAHAPGTPDCGIAIFGALENGCHCLLDYATHLLQRALLADTVPDIPEIARLITLALGTRGAVIEVRSPQLPGWWFLI